MPQGINGIPDETLEEIFQHIPIPDYLLYPSFHPGRDSLWCQNIRSKKSALLVCRKWNSIGLPLLYRNIAINNFGALVRLYKTIEDNPTRIGTLVQSLRLVYIIPKICYDLMSYSLDMIFDLCPNLRRVAYEYECMRFRNISPTLSISADVEQLALWGHCSISKLLPSLPSSLTHLAIRTENLNINATEAL